ncbi:adhesion G protein-coupled receptor E4P, partial [Biomphalaria glabrata]
QVYPKRWPKCDCSISVVISTTAFVPFTLRLDLKDTEENVKIIPGATATTQSSRCSQDEWEAPDKLCFQLHCTPGKIFRNGTCVEIIEDIKGLAYEMALYLVPLKADNTTFKGTHLLHSVAGNLTDAIKFKVKSLLLELSDDILVQIQAFRNKNVGTMHAILDIYFIDFKIVAIESLTRNEFEKQVLGIFSTNEFVLEDTKNKTQVMKFEMFQVTGMLATDQLSQSNYSVYSHQIYDSKRRVRFVDIMKYINVTLVLLCRYVHLDSKSYQVKVNYQVLPPDISIKIDLNRSTLYVVDQRDLTMVEVDEDGGLNVCVELLDKLIGQQQQSFLSLMAKWLKGTNLVEYIVSLVCFVASIICLLTSLFTYWIFPVLKTEAAINNMFLSGSLLLAQVSLLVSSQSIRASTLCTALGVLTHFLWLWNFTWSFICSYHMYKVFASNVPSSTTVQPRKLWMTITCSILFPTLIIVTTVVFNLLKSDGQDIGYGRSVCFFNSVFIFGVTVIGPLSVITVIDIIFFTISFYKIWKVRLLDTSITNHDENFVFAYAQLSTLSVAFWTVTYLAVTFDNGVLRLLSSLLNGLQGVLMFKSFTCNKSVFIHFKKKLMKI